MKRLPWKIEAFREYLTYEVLQPAASVLQIFEGEEFAIKNPKILRMQSMIESRTNKAAWVPRRTGSEKIKWNTEGDLTRNKGRLLTSMLILHPKEWVENRIQLTPFGHALADGKISSDQFYDFILTHFRYPHPVWKDNWEAWTNEGKQLYPFLYLLEALVALYKVSPEHAHLSTDEIADYLHVKPDHDQVTSHVESIVEAREKESPSITPRQDAIHRKISDIMGFLCLTRYCYYSGNRIQLNLLDRHETEKVNFYISRKGQDKLEEIKALLDLAAHQVG